MVDAMVDVSLIETGAVRLELRRLDAAPVVRDVVELIERTGKAPGARELLEEVLRRARLPLYLAGGARRPDPIGRAFLLLLRCRSQISRASGAGFALTPLIPPRASRLRSIPHSRMNSSTSGGSRSLLK